MAPPAQVEEGGRTVYVWVEDNKGEITVHSHASPEETHTADGSTKGQLVAKIQKRAKALEAASSVGSASGAAGVKMQISGITADEEALARMVAAESSSAEWSPEKYANDKLSAVGSAVHPHVPIWKLGDPARGILRIDGAEIPLKSGGGSPGSSLKQLPGGAGSGLNAQIPTHVEGHAAAIMRALRIRSAVLFINKSPCATGAQCRFNLNKFLPPDSTLILHFLGDDGLTVTTWLFKSGTPRWEVFP